MIDEGAKLGVLDDLVASGEITEEQKLAAADGYTSTKVRQLYVLSRLLEDGKITREQYVEAAAWPITPDVVEPKTGCANAGGAAYFCQYVKYVILNDPAFGETAEDAPGHPAARRPQRLHDARPAHPGPGRAGDGHVRADRIQMRQGTTVPRPAASDRPR